MSLTYRDRSRGPRNALSAGIAALLIVGAAGTGCDGTDAQTTPEPCASSTLVSRIGVHPNDQAPKLDLVLAIDNSRSMGDKQAILAMSVPDLVNRLVNPPCVDMNGAPAAAQPSGPQEACPTPGTRRAAQPVVDMHIGVISSSLGGHGADACPDVDEKACAPSTNLTNNDKGHLISRRDACGLEGKVATYQARGFLAWDPAQAKNPPGEGDTQSLTNSLREMIVGAGQVGCGYEAQLESWYRFLVDPDPYETITAIDGKAVPEGVDQTLLAQRADFLRPDSLLAILMISDENDCSIKEFGQFFFAGQLKNKNGTSFHLPRARGECALNPNDPCCLSCGQNAGSCPPDPTCFDADNEIKALTDAEDPSNLRCFDQKRRFGIDFLYPIDRYTQGLQSVTVPNRSGELVPNPIFTDLKPLDASSNVRDPGMVFLLGIVGVPWQDIARDPNDLAKGFKSADELLITDANGTSTWDVILGDPAKYVPPADPHMIESPDARSGVNPVTGDALVPPGDPATNPINGRERTIHGRDDLQYACIFPLPTPQDCLGPNGSLGCDCPLSDPPTDNPLCEDNPAMPGTKTLQTKGKAYPSIRQLALLRSLSTQGLTASICPAQVSAPDAPDFGYRPAIDLFINRIAGVADFSCLPRTLDVNEEGQVACRIVEARAVPDQGQCACDEKGQKSLSPDDIGLASAIKSDPVASQAGLNCLCELEQLKNDDVTGDLSSCQDDTAIVPVNASGEPVHGWCYIDATTTPVTGNPELVKTCPETEKRRIRFVGNAASPDHLLFVTCSSSCDE